LVFSLDLVLSIPNKQLVRNSGVKKVHDWSVDQIPDLFRVSHKVKTQQVSRIRGQRRGDNEFTVYLLNELGPVTLVLELRIVHERFASRSDPSLNGHLHYPNDIDGSLNGLGGYMVNL
jgi:hypothetical protein